MVHLDCSFLNMKITDKGLAIEWIPVDKIMLNKNVSISRQCKVHAYGNLLVSPRHRTEFSHWKSFWKTVLKYSIQTGMSNLPGCGYGLL